MTSKISKTVVLLVFISVIVSVEVKRVKRAKYYSYPSRFYRKPPPPHVIKGAFSYTPPPNYMHDDSPVQYKAKVSRKPPNDGLGDEDISNLVKHLSKKDLDKIVDYAVEKERLTDKYRDDSNENDYKHFVRPERNTFKHDDLEQFAQNIHHLKDVDFEDLNTKYGGNPRILNSPPLNYRDENPNLNIINEASQTKVIYVNPESKSPKVTYSTHQESQLSNNIQATNFRQSFPNIPNSNSNAQFSNAQFSNRYPEQIQNNVPLPNVNIIPSISQNLYPSNDYTLDTGETMHQYIAYVTVPPNTNKDVLFTDSDTMKEEEIPKPLNLRDDYETANTDNAPKVVKPTYKVESFKDLPLMNYDSKLHTVSSYHVPHYVVTSTKSQSPPAPQKQPTPGIPLEKAPPGATGQDQSDAHLKAIKIWTHRSKGTAYTLHDDGTLSLEKPMVRTSYGYAN